MIEPYWQWQRKALLPPLPSWPGGKQRVDVAVIGGGLSGLSAAYHILGRHRGARVVVLEAFTLASGASGRSTGMLSPGVGQSIEALVRRLGAPQARALYVQTLHAVRAVQALIHDEKIDCDLQLSGQIIYAKSSSQRRRLLRQAALFDALDLTPEVEILDDAALANHLHLAPAAGGPGPAALRLPTAGILDPLRLVVGLCQRVQARGGQVYEQARVTAIDDGDARDPVRLRLAFGEVLADQVVVATAGFAPQLGLLRGRLLPVMLQALVSEPLSDPTYEQLAWTGRDGFLDAGRLFNYFRLTADRRILFGGGRPRYFWNGSDGTATALSASLADLADRFAQVFPAALGVRPVGGWGGTIGYVVDALPAIGRLPRRPQIVHAVGWCGHGVALATACGAWLADLLDGCPLPELPWFRSTAPRVPTELGRYLGFQAATRFMALRDKWS